MSSPQLTEISAIDLEHVCGGVDPAACTPDNPTGARQPTQYFENDRSGPSLSQRVIESTDRAMAPWKLFNGIFGGARGPSVTAPTPPRPTYR